jgi:carboxylate-amine ligase
MNFSVPLLDGLRLALSGDLSRVILRSNGSSFYGAADYSFGIEEEYFLVKADTLDVAHTTPDEFFEAVNWATGGQAMREMLQAQLEVVTNIHVDTRDALQELLFLRQEASRVANQFGMAIMACGTHPTASWKRSQLSPKPRYTQMIDDLEIVGRRNMLCGMHVHVQLPDLKQRFRVMRSMTSFLPLFIALATSSPFWNAQRTGLKGYRLAAYDELPRTGLPELFETEDDYRTYLSCLRRSGVIPDESHVWWALRPSSKHPTLELRAPDSCTRVTDAVAIAALYRSLVRHLDREGEQRPRLTSVDRAIAVENKWRAQRYGVGGTFVSRDGAISVRELLDGIISQIAPDADELGCLQEVLHCKHLVANGTSADAQLYAATGPGKDLGSAKRWIAETTIAPATPHRKASTVSSDHG